MDDHPLRPPTRRSLGGPLPRQLANGPRAHPRAKNFEESGHAAILFASGITPRFRELFRTRGQVAHVLLTLSPLSATRGWLIVRLACLIHAASVHSEPGSNSPSQKWKGCPGKPRAWPVLLSISLRGLSPSQRQGGSFRSLHKQSHHIALLDFQRTAPTSRETRENRRFD